jgi:hypothetical protein
MQGEAVSAGLAGLARAFPRPRHGRYAAAPARTDESGITFLPPPVPDFFPKIAAAVGLSSLALAALVVVSRRSSR